MAGFTNAYAAAALDILFPTTGASEFIAYSVNGSSEWAGLARTAIGATGWDAATVADPSVKSNGGVLTSAATSLASQVTHFAVFDESVAGVQRTDWTALDTPRDVLVGDSLQWAAGALDITLS
jgi:hypothetical protein